MGTIEILLVRHGVPMCDHRTRIRGCDFGDWVTAYDNAPIDPASRPAAQLAERVSAMPCVATSILRRAIESASIVAPGRPLVSDPLFNEAAIPTAIQLRLALPPGQWDALARAAWLLGWAPGAESAREASARAARAADQLIALATQHGGVALVGHGMLNSLITRALRRAGWTGSGSPRSYWGSVALRRAF